MSYGAVWRGAARGIKLRALSESARTEESVCDTATRAREGGIEFVGEREGGDFVVDEEGESGEVSA